MRNQVMVARALVRGLLDGIEGRADLAVWASLARQQLEGEGVG